MIVTGIRGTDVVWQALGELCEALDAEGVRMLGARSGSSGSAAMRSTYARVDIELPERMSIRIGGEYDMRIALSCSREENYLLIFRPRRYGIDNAKKAAATAAEAIDDLRTRRERNEADGAGTDAREEAVTAAMVAAGWDFQGRDGDANLYNLWLCETDRWRGVKLTSTATDTTVSVGVRLGPSHAPWFLAGKYTLTTDDPAKVPALAAQAVKAVQGLLAHVLPVLP